MLSFLNIRQLILCTKYLSLRPTNIILYKTSGVNYILYKTFNTLPHSLPHDRGRYYDGHGRSSFTWGGLYFVQRSHRDYLISHSLNMLVDWHDPFPPSRNQIKLIIFSVVKNRGHLGMHFITVINLRPLWGFALRRTSDQYEFKQNGGAYWGGTLGHYKIASLEGSNNAGLPTISSTFVRHSEPPRGRGALE